MISFLLNYLVIETTKATPANTAKSLRTTMPMSIVKMFEPDENSYIEWHVDVKNNIIVTIRKKE